MYTYMLVRRVLSADQQRSTRKKYKVRTRSGHREGLHPEAENKTEREREGGREEGYEAMKYWD